MRDLWPAAKLHALAAAVFGVLIGLLYAFMPQPNQFLVLGIAIAYILVLNRYLARAMPQPPFARARKGSHKPDKRAGWKITAWAFRTALVGMAVQVTVFVLAFLVVQSLLARR